MHNAEITLKLNLKTVLKLIKLIELGRIISEVVYDDKKTINDFGECAYSARFQILSGYSKIGGDFFKLSTIATNAAIRAIHDYYSSPKTAKIAA